MKARNALSGPTAALVLAGMCTAMIALWFVARPDGGGSIMLVCAVVSVPVWLAIGVQRLRARRAAVERTAPPT
ncbi:hypothetical protein ACFUV1_26215 [Streptomyces griseoincarnatus]